MTDPAAHLRRLREHLREALSAVDALLAAEPPPGPAPKAESGWWLEFRRSPRGWAPATVHRAACFVRAEHRRDLTPEEARALLSAPGVDACPGCRPDHPDG